MKNWTLKGILAGKYSTTWPLSGSNHGQTNTLGLPAIGEYKANSCGECIGVCPTDALSVDQKLGMKIDYGRCIGCQLCVEACKCGSIQNSFDFDRSTATRENLIHRQFDDTEITIQLGRKVNSIFNGSLHIKHIDAGSCNGCESEIQALVNPFYNLHRLGIFFTSSPRFADLLLVTGPVVPQMSEPLLRTYEAMGEPRLVMATGACAIDGAPFDKGYAGGGGADKHLPVDIFVPGCPPSPPALIYGLLLLLGRIAHQPKRGGDVD